MADVPVYFYETEIEWIGAKDLQISSGKLPGIAGGAHRSSKAGRECGRRSICSSRRSIVVTC